MDLLTILKIVFILILCLIPSLVSWLVIKKAKQRLQNRLRRERARAAIRQQATMEFPPDFEESTVHGHFIGDPSCRYNAHSPYIRCAVNPEGPCKSCPHYEEKE